MSEREHLAYVIENHFSNPQASTFVHFVTVTDGLTAAQASTVPAERFNSVWAVVNHVAFWQEYSRLALLGQALQPGDWGLTEIGGGWPPLGEVSDKNWQAARQHALDGNHAFAQTILGLDDAQFAQPFEMLGGPGYQGVLGIYAHNCHHTSEILSIRHLLKLWVDHPWV